MSTCLCVQNKSWLKMPHHSRDCRIKCVLAASSPISVPSLSMPGQLVAVFVRRAYSDIDEHDCSCCRRSKSSSPILTMLTKLSSLQHPATAISTLLHRVHCSLYGHIFAAVEGTRQMVLYNIHLHRCKLSPCRLQYILKQH